MVHPDGGQPTGTSATQSDESSDFIGRSLPSGRPLERWTQTEDVSDHVVAEQVLGQGSAENVSDVGAPGSGLSSDVLDGPPSVFLDADMPVIGRDSSLTADLGETVSETDMGRDTPFELTSTAFSEGESIPYRYTGCRSSQPNGIQIGTGSHCTCGGSPERALPASMSDREEIRNILLSPGHRPNGSDQNTFDGVFLSTR